MSVCSAIHRAVNTKIVHEKVNGAGVLRDEDGWCFEESQDFSRWEIGNEISSSLF